MLNCNLKRNKNKKQCIEERKRFNSVGEGSFKLILPKNDNSGKPIASFRIQSYISKMNKIFGGTTTVPRTEGCYSESGKKGDFQCESGIMVVGVRDFDNPYANDPKITKPLPRFGKYPKDLNQKERKEQLKQDHSYLKSLAKKASKEFGQSSVFYEYDNIVDGAMARRKKSYKPQGVPLRVGFKQIFDNLSDDEIDEVRKIIKEKKEKEKEKTNF